ncbi:hypothetical protein [Halorarius litoreus]|uniref:hypothetical protein n=1 Tax=Halorarius litoreus TaxID=2962676 RepID=UPI0020CDBCBD|nr:hypothetical protein [Halorarius litoreus]
MRPRLPSVDPFSASFGVFLGTWAALVVAWQVPSLLAVVAGLGVLVALVTWVGVEQVPAFVDGALVHRLHLVVAGLAALPLVASLLLVERTAVARSSPVLLLAFAVAIAGFAAVVTGTSRRARVFRDRERVHLTLSAVEPRRRRAALTLVTMLAVYAVLGVVAGDLLSLWSVVGLVSGVSVGTLVVGRQRVDLVALDSGLLVRPGRQFGTSFVPWSQVVRITVDGDTLRLHRGLPWPLVYRVDLDDCPDREATVSTLRARVA